MFGRNKVVIIGIIDMVFKLALYAVYIFAIALQNYTKFVECLDAWAGIILIYLFLCLLLIAGAKLGRWMLMFPWLIFGWLQAILVIPFLGNLAYLLCFRPGLFTHYASSLQKFAVLGSYTGWSIYSLLAVGKVYKRFREMLLSTSSESEI